MYTHIHTYNLSIYRDDPPRLGRARLWHAGITIVSLS